jgi:hypothetical protein
MDIERLARSGALAALELKRCVGLNSIILFADFRVKQQGR